MAITFTNQGASANPDFLDRANAASYVTPAGGWTPPTTGIIGLWVFNWIAAIGNVPTVSGNGVTWVQVATVAVDPGTSERITLFGAFAAGATAGQTTINFAAQTQLGCDCHFFQITGADESGTIANAFVQTPNANGTGTASSVTLAAAGHADNRPISAHSHLANEVTTPRTNWTEFDDFNSAGPNAGGEDQVRSDAFETTASASWATSVAWLAMAAEVKAAVAGGAATHLGWYQSSGGWF